MFTHKVLINTACSMYQLKLDLVDNDFHICKFSKESLIFYEELFWTQSFLRPMVRCNRKREGIIELCFYLRKIDRILLLLYLSMGCIISLLTLVLTKSVELPLVIILWICVSLLLFWIYFKHHCKHITKKIVSLQN